MSQSNSQLFRYNINQYYLQNEGDLQYVREFNSLILKFFGLLEIMHPCKSTISKKSIKSDEIFKKE